MDSGPAIRITPALRLRLRTDEGLQLEQAARAGPLALRLDVAAHPVEHAHEACVVGERPEDRVAHEQSVVTIPCLERPFEPIHRCIGITTEGRPRCQLEALDRCVVAGRNPLAGK